MTPDQRTLSIWGGGLAAGVILGWIILGPVRGEELATQAARAESLGKEYQNLYPAEGMAIEEATGTWKRLMEHQKAALTDAEASMVPVLPREYQETDLNSGAARVHADLQFLKQKAQRTQVRLPSTLPFEEGLSDNASQRLLQLAQLYLYRNLLDTCMEAGITKINTVKTESGPCDPQGKYALMLCSVDMDMPWERTSQLLVDLNQTQNRKGYGVRNVSINFESSGNQKVSLVVSLITANNPAWNLHPDSAPTSIQAVPANSTGTGGTGTGNRFGRFGGN